ncbi:MAG: OsmC family protein [Candidatus Thiodiazotropha endolucinida]|uniref:OsmC-like protein n=1 Tax=Candidatus Thiodiazotropha endolucinida TaxID=1655433 RepID=A0A7Z0VK55_9GAMM|nr:OsmC family protein [Candidatus Thiodiazotropha endolucinida]ODJ86716.1 OsmC-like protein [Candidatus Thiodiazotropha endolucinida]
MNSKQVRESQKPLRQKYTTEPGAAKVIDHARTRHADAQDPFHTTVEPMPGIGTTIPVGVHRAIGGPHDAPTPGDILCAALAACLDSTVRMIANLLGVELDHLEVSVDAEVDVRGTMLVNRDVPVGFQALRCHVDQRAKEGTPVELVERLCNAAEYSCIVLQTLRSPPPVHTEFSTH